MVPRLVSFSIGKYELGLDHVYGDIFPMEFTQPGALLEGDIYSCIIICPSKMFMHS